MNELSPCPYCLSESLIINHTLLGYQISCQNCQASGPKHLEKEEAISQWQALANDMEASRHYHAKEFVDRLKQVESALAKRRRTQ